MSKSLILGAGGSSERVGLVKDSCVSLKEGPFLNGCTAGGVVGGEEELELVVLVS